MNIIQTPLKDINMYERKVLLHSYLYYQLDKNVIGDEKFDEWCFDLVRLMEEYPEEFKQSVYYKDFKDFDGSTGADLHYKKPEIVNRASHLFLGGK